MLIFQLLCMLPFIPLVGISGIIKNYYLGKEDVWNLSLAQLFEEVSRIVFTYIVIQKFHHLPNTLFSQHCYYCYEYWRNHFYSFFNVSVFKKESQLALSSPFLFSKSLSIQRYDEYCFTLNRIKTVACWLQFFRTHSSCFDFEQNYILKKPKFIFNMQ